MRNSIFCRIEYLCAATEEAVIIGLDTKELSEAYILLSAFSSNKLDKVVFKDSNNAHTFLLTHTKNVSKKDAQMLQFDERSYLLNNTWFENVLGMLIEVLLNGWYQGAHVDFDFKDGKNEFQLCFAINPPPYQDRA